jgi:hypothetical protein
MPILIPSGRNFSLKPKTGGGLASVGVAAGGGNIVLPAANLVIDTFETANMQPTLNNVGFTWGANLKTSIVTMNPGPIAVWNNQVISNAGSEGSDWTAKEGNHSLRFRYTPGAELTEQRYDLGAYQTEVWFRYWLRVPVNFTQGSQNNKFFVICPTFATYDQPGTLTIQTRPDGSGGSNAVYQDGGASSGEVGSTPYISVPADRGRWMQVVLRFKRASTPTANDGAFQHWRRWEDESAFTLIHSKLNAQLYNSTDPNGFRAGYFMGWANDPFTVETEFLMDTVEIHNQPLVPAGTAGLI